MNNKRSRFFPLFLALSAVLIIAGILMYAFFGFNNAPDRPAAYALEIKYSVVIGIDEAQQEKVRALAESSMEKHGIAFSEGVTAPVVDSESLAETTDTVLTYKLGASLDEKELAAVVAEINAMEEYRGARVYASYHFLEEQPYFEAAWRAAVALAVAAVVALGYLTIRFGVSCGVAGLAVTAHDVLLTLALLALARVPVYSLMPAVYAGVAAFVSVFLWMIACMRMRETFKSEAYASMTAGEAVAAAMRAALRPVCLTALALGIVVLVLGACGVFGTMAAVLPALLAVAVPVYSTLLIGPNIVVPIKRAFDRRKAAKKGGYVAAKKGAQKSE